MTINGIVKMVETLNAFYPYKFKPENNDSLIFGLRSEFSDCYDEPTLEVLEIKCKESRNPVDLREVKKRSKLLLNLYVNNYEAKLRAYNDHLAKGEADYSVLPSVFALFGDPDGKPSFEEMAESLRKGLNYSIGNLPIEYRTENGIKEV